MEDDRTNVEENENSDNLTSEIVRNDFSLDNNQSDLLTSSSLPVHYLDVPLNISNGSKTGGYVSFSDRKSFDLSQFISPTNENDEDEKKKIDEAKKHIFPTPIIPTFADAAETLRNERRDEFSPIYPNETAEEVARRQSKRKPVGSLLSKRIRFDDLKRKREENEARQRFYQQQYHYGPYETSYEQQMQYQNEIARVQQEHSGFWPELQQQQQQQQQQEAFQSTNSNGNSSWFYSNSFYAPPPPPPPPPPSEPYPY